MRRWIVAWLLLLGLFWAGCTTTPAAVSPQISVVTRIVPSPTETAPVIAPSLEPLPATQTAVPTATSFPTAIPVTPEATATLEPTPTFAAFGVAQTIGLSAGGRPVESYRFGYGSQTVVLVGGMHGGYEWNTILLAYEMIDYFTENPDQVPANISLYIIPAANPDGQFMVTGVDGRFTAADVTSDTTPGRLNANQVDLNRNWACDWQREAQWGNTIVSGGAVPFSEPETAALRTFFLREDPEVVLFWHSKAGGLYVGSCGGLYQPSKDVAQLYSQASGYEVYDQFTAYPVSGDASDWLATQGVPSFTVELHTHSNIDWEMNLAGVQALLAHYGR